MGTEQEEEFRAFVAARSRALTSTAYLLTGDAEQASDLVQSALAATWVRWSKLKDRGHIEAYVRKTIYHAYVSRTRLLSWRRERSTAEPPERPDAGSDLADTVARSQDVAALVRRLPRGQRAVIVLSYYEDKSDAEEACALLSGKRQEIVARYLGLFHGANSRMHHRVAIAHDDRTVGLPAYMARRNRQFTPTPLFLHNGFIEFDHYIYLPLIGAVLR